ncbi:cytosine permease [Acidiferrimicrobium sp. IK]|uniref:purine-cytosine permease family protein n=1 Tax=Acidiferrimicrobium sp. IK TaxID=2871700 RepID=UPI0021CB4B3E|nr:cytosine permease [Acidiferrimicrobium sp. IK]MCU4186033.1 cytosine permease [Acidiferrimicrobium sp. IK]
MVTAPETIAPASDRAFAVEQRGIDYVPLSERWARPHHLFGMWAGSSVQFEYLVYGAVLMTFGLSFGQAVVCIVVGNLSYVLLGLCSLQGPVAGTTVFTINRASFGPNGSRLMALLNWATQVGFETEGLTLIVLAAVALSAKAGWSAGTGGKIIFIVAAAAIQTVLPFLGHATVVKALRAMIAPFCVIYVILAALTLGKANPGGVHSSADAGTFMVGLAFVITLAGLGWVECGNDFSRYLPPDASKKGIVGWIFLGTAVPEILIMLLGAAVATYVSSAGDNPVTNFPHAFSGWFLWPFLVAAIVQLFAINCLDLYSSGVTLQAIGLPVKRWQAVLIDTVVAGGLTTYAVFSSSFNRLLGDFVAAVIAWIGPWMAIFLVDWVLRRYRYPVGELQRTDRGSLFWSRGGVRWAAVGSWILGCAASVLAFNQTFYVGPISTLATGADLSVFTGIAVAGVAYLLLAGRQVRKEAADPRHDDTTSLEPVAAS